MGRVSALITVAFVLLAGGVPGGAQGLHGIQPSPEHSTEAEHGESAWAVVLRWANFFVLFGGLGYLLRKPAGEFFEARRDDIQTGLERARQAQEDAGLRMSEIEARLKRLSGELGAIRSRAEEEALVERTRILEEARREVDRIVEQSRQEIDRTARGLEKQIRARVADLVVERAEKNLREQMRHEDQKRVVVRFVKSL